MIGSTLRNAFMITGAVALPMPLQWANILSPTTTTLGARQVGNAPNAPTSGNVTGTTGTVAPSGTIGDGNGVGNAGVGNDIDTGMCSQKNSFSALSLTSQWSVLYLHESVQCWLVFEAKHRRHETGDDFDIGDGNNTIGDNNTIQIGDRIYNINLAPGSTANLTSIVLGKRSVGRSVSVDGSEQTFPVDSLLDLRLSIRMAEDGGSVAVSVVPT